MIIANSISIPSGSKFSDPFAEYTNTSSFSFDGTNEYIDLGPTMSNVTPSNADYVSFEFWWKPTAIGTKIMFHSIATHFIRIGHFSGQLHFDFSTASSTQNYYTWIPAINTWYHITMVFDGTQPVYTDRIKIYVDGSPVSVTVGAGMISNTKTPDWTTYPTGSNYIGQQAGGLYRVQGNMLGFRVYDYALTDANVTELYNAGVPYNAGNLSTPPIHEWEMGDNDDPTSIVYDNYGSTVGTPQNMEIGDKVNDIPS